MLFSGISTILAGIGNRKEPGWSRAANTGVEVLAVVISGIALMLPFFGALLVALMMAMALLIYGMGLITLGYGTKADNDSSSGSVRYDHRSLISYGMFFCISHDWTITS